MDTALTLFLRCFFECLICFPYFLFSNPDPMANVPLAPQSLMSGRDIQIQTPVVFTFLRKSCEPNIIGTPEFCSDMKRTEACVNVKTNEETIGSRQEACTCIEPKELIETVLPVEAPFVAPFVDSLSIQSSTLTSIVSDDNTCNKPMDWHQNIETHVHVPRAIAEVTKAVAEKNTPFEVEPLATLGGVGQCSAQTFPSKFT